MVTGTRLKTLAIGGCIAGAIGAMWLAFTTWTELYFFGFPDGHVTDFEKAADAPLTITAWLAAALGVLLLGLAVAPIGTRRRTVGLLAAVTVLVILTIGARIGVPWYFGTHLGLDNGIGG